MEDKAREAESKARALELRLGGDLTRESRVNTLYLTANVKFIPEEIQRNILELNKGTAGCAC